MMLQLSNSVASKQVRNSGNIVRYTVLSADALSDFAKMSRDVTCDTVAHLSWKDWFHRRFEMLHTVWQLDVMVKIHKEGRCGRWSCNIFIFLNADDLFDLDILFFLKELWWKASKLFLSFPARLCNSWLCNAEICGNTIQIRVYSTDGNFVRVQNTFGCSLFLHSDIWLCNDGARHSELVSLRSSTFADATGHSNTYLCRIPSLSSLSSLQ